MGREGLGSGSGGGGVEGKSALLMQDAGPLRLTVQSRRRRKNM